MYGHKDKIEQTNQLDTTCGNKRLDKMEGLLPTQAVTQGQLP